MKKNLKEKLVYKINKKEIPKEFHKYISKETKTLCAQLIYPMFISRKLKSGLKFSGFDVLPTASIKTDICFMFDGKKYVFDHIKEHAINIFNYHTVWSRDFKSFKEFYESELK